MISEFPKFKKLSLADKAQVDTITAKFPPYSDFEFASLWAWDVKEEMAITDLNGNLAIRFTDYLSGEPFYTFLGADYTNETADTLLTYAAAEGHEARLKLVPEIAVVTMDNRRFSIEEDRDHFDYIYAIKSHVDYKEPALKSVRNTLNAHRRRHFGHITVQLELSDRSTDALIFDLCERWERRSKMPIQNESAALSRFLKAAPTFKCVAVGIIYGETLVGISLTVLLDKGNCSCLFARGDTAYHGIYALLMHETAKILIEKGYQFMNYEQDLGIPNLRSAKLAFNPTYFLKKYVVGRVDK